MNSFKRLRSPAGFTLIEILLVVAAVISLLAILSLAFGPVKTIISRGICISNQRTVQNGVRAYAAGYNIPIGGAVASSAIIGTGLLVPAAPVCGNSGTYTYTGTVPAQGARYATCSVTGDVATDLSTW